MAGAGAGVIVQRMHIKGNHSRRGDWIYHKPGMPYCAERRPQAMF
ncbi:MAG: hypothetical protein Q8R44_04220 [Novosphingobium sp.]|nr:hypothetical protein [Novosphingobium sp.]